MLSHIRMKLFFMFSGLSLYGDEPEPRFKDEKIPVLTPPSLVEKP